MRRIVFALTLLLMSCAGGFASRKDCMANCNMSRGSCKKIDGEWVCGVAWDEVRGSNGGASDDE